MPDMTDQDALVASAGRLGLSPVEWGALLSYESGLDPTRWGGAKNADGSPRHVGLIQFGPDEQRQFGVTGRETFQEQLPKAEAFMSARGYQPGMGLMQAYSTVNAGSPGHLDASDAGNGGMPGTVADKVNTQFGQHFKRAAAFLGGSFSPGSASPMGAFGLSGPVAAGTPGSVTPAVGATMQTPQADSGPDVASLLKALGGTDQTAASAAQAQAKAPAPMALQPHQRRGSPFDATRYLASLARQPRA